MIQTINSDLVKAQVRGLINLAGVHNRRSERVLSLYYTQEPKRNGAHHARETTEEPPATRVGPKSLRSGKPGPKRSRRVVALPNRERPSHTRYRANQAPASN